jgi:hypothetical protein
MKLRPAEMPIERAYLTQDETRETNRYGLGNRCSIQLSYGTTQVFYLHR